MPYLLPCAMLDSPSKTLTCSKSMRCVHHQCSFVTLPYKLYFPFDHSPFCFTLFDTFLPSPHLPYLCLSLSPLLFNSLPLMHYPLCSFSDSLLCFLPPFTFLSDLSSPLLLHHLQAFASQCLYCVRHLGIPIEKINPYGGAIAMGHPLGCSGKSSIHTAQHSTAQHSTAQHSAVQCSAVQCSGFFHHHLLFPWLDLIILWTHIWFGVAWWHVGVKCILFSSIPLHYFFLLHLVTLSNLTSSYIRFLPNTCASQYMIHI